MWQSSYSTTCDNFKAIQYAMNSRRRFWRIQIFQFIQFDWTNKFYIGNTDNEENTALWMFHFLNWTGMTKLCLRYRCWFSLTEHWKLYLNVLLYSNTGIEKFSWGWISIRIRIRYSTNSKVNIRIWRMRTFFRFVTSLAHISKHVDLSLQLVEILSHLPHSPCSQQTTITRFPWSWE